MTVTRWFVVGVWAVVFVTAADADGWAGVVATALVSTGVGVATVVLARRRLER